jgi:hypothetical protein
MTETQFPTDKTYTTNEMTRMLKDAKLTLNAMWETNLFHDEFLKHFELLEMLCDFVLYDKGGVKVFEFLSYMGWADKGECDKLLRTLFADELEGGE